MSEAPERIWASFTNWRNAHEGHCYRSNTAGGVEYIRADIYEAQAARIADLERQLAERQDQVHRLLAVQAKRKVDHERQIAQARDKALEEAAALAHDMLVTNPNHDPARRIVCFAIRNLKGTP